ncbi:MAG: hypothetical protein A3F84_18635 [Candidatus Handelsmanbacteria bacterium RIFCSPLOWO2_12_FULL_64_10]|uniref:SH3b domain-containing protein n=1 Tax=Handelsmanbacteria sp. (strain RIFCSPLOWO2_12_FULL_64_10) TaxID=1817868 RepID=A0A1F6CBK3_HANXR|nr:MAG: hypothetical protein A3F84_18635 [Candidatus Handelsmanbacteria bacterium RIFCSPLOWO2_12_FULL_64_10]
MIACPGCGGRNEPDAKTCAWCARPFVAQPRRIPVAVFALSGAVLLGVAIVIGAFFAVTTLLAVLTPSPSTEGPAAQPTVGVPTPTLVAEPVPQSDATPRPEGEYVRVANTGGTGAFIREEPRANARGIAAYPDRTVLRIIGTDISAEGRAWRNVEDQRGIRGWTPGEFLVPSDVGF